MRVFLFELGPIAHSNVLIRADFPIRVIALLSTKRSAWWVQAIEAARIADLLRNMHIVHQSSYQSN